jgi:phage gp29-like protein
LAPRGIVAPISRYERFNTSASGRFGDMWAPQLTAILWKLDQGYLDDWADLVEFAISTDATLASLYVTRISRVAQASFNVVPSKFGDPTLAKQAADFVRSQMARVEDFQSTIKHLLHAIFVGQSFAEMEWMRDGPDSDPTYYVRRFLPLHTHRFRYDEKWLPRLYDRGMRAGKGNGTNDIYGEVLDPRRFVVHRHQEIAGYPSVAGVMRPGIWTWLFMRWTDRWALNATEQHGKPFIYAKVAANTPESVRNEIKQNLEDLTSDHVAVVEQGGEIVFQSSTLTTSSSNMFELMLNRYEARLGKLIMGASDITDPGKSGSQAAVTTRAGVTADPRMVTDGIALSGTIERSYFKWLLTLNVHKFGGGMPPVPTWEAKTAGDEVQVDKQDAIEQGVASSGVAPSERAVGTHGSVDEAAAAAMSATIEAAPDPKVLRRSSSGRQTAVAMTRTSSPTSTISPTSLPSATKLAQALRGASVDRRR